MNDNSPPIYRWDHVGELIQQSVKRTAESVQNPER